MKWLHIEHDGHVATVILDRPPVNAVDNEVLIEIRDVFGGFEEDRDLRAVIFTAAGDRAFMGGADLNSVGSRDRSESVSPRYITDAARVARDAMWAVTDCAVPVVGAINGPRQQEERGNWQSTVCLWARGPRTDGCTRSPRARAPAHAAGCTELHSCDCRRAAFRFPPSA